MNLRTPSALVDYIRSHGHVAKLTTDGIVAEERYTYTASDGAVASGVELVRIEPTWEAVRTWLGY